MDKADLDFGIYRILRQRHAEITEFFDHHLEKTVREALMRHGCLQQGNLADDLKKGCDLDALADEVYSHLYTFFSRYYQEGDFLGLHRSTVLGKERCRSPTTGKK